MPSKMHLPATAIVFLSLLAFGLSDVVIETTAGKVRGLSTFIPDGTLSIFYGIPFAKPPLGELRFRKPQKPDPWTNLLDATKKPNSCIQKQWSEIVDFEWVKRLDVTTNISEDCLYLNVWTPAKIQNGAAEDKTLPVIFWIHGGGFVSGSSMVDMYDGTYITVKERVVFVSMNYRLGSFGFLYLGNEQVPGNMGLYDMVMALDWVKHNIGAFGGNPELVTIIGESAGGASVSALLLSPESRDKFKYAVIQSGSMLSIWSHKTKERSLDLAKSISVKVNCTQASDTKWDSQESIPSNLVDCLRKLDAKILNAAMYTTMEVPTFHQTTSPTNDGHFFPTSPSEMLADKNFKLNTKIMSGHTSKEGSIFFLSSPIYKEFTDKKVEIFVSKDVAQQIVSQLMPSSTDLERDLVYYAYNDWTRPGNTTNHRDSIVDLTGDVLIVCSHLQFTKEISDVNTVYYYQFNHRPNINKKFPQWTGAMHTDEIQFFFGSVFNKSYGFNDDDRKMSAVMMKHLANFARTGSPVPQNQASTWPPFTSTEQVTHAYGFHNNEILGPRARQCALFSEILPKMGQCKIPDLHSRASANRLCLLQAIYIIAGFLMIYLA